MSSPEFGIRHSEFAIAVVEHLPAKVQDAVIEYEHKTAAAQTRPVAERPERRSEVKRELTPEERVLRMVRMFGRQYQKKVLEEKLLAVLVAFGKAVPTSRRKATCERGRRVFSALVRSRGGEPPRVRTIENQKNEARRAVRLKQLELRAAKEGIDPEPAAHEAFSQLEQEGRIDWLPTDECTNRAWIEIHHLAGRRESFPTHRSTSRRSLGRGSGGFGCGPGWAGPSRPG